MPPEINPEELKQTIKVLEEKCAFLEASDQKFRSLFNGSMDGLLIVESGGGRIICANKQIGTMLGYAGSALQGRDFQVLLPETTNQPKKDLLQEVQVCGGVFTQEFLHSDGRVCVLDLMATLIPWEKDWAILCTLRDATERIQLEKQLRQSQKMEAIGNLAGGVAHDFNNILSGLVSYPDLLLLDLPEESILRKPILTIKRSGERAAEIVEDLLTLTKHGIGAGEVINLNQIISAYENSSEYERLKNYHPHVHLTKRLAEDLKPVAGSMEHLSKALANLVLNAAGAMPEGGEVQVLTENHHVDGVQNECFTEAGDYAVLRVSGSGMPISPNDLERIFEPFYTSKKMGRNDTGLGMTVVWRTVKDHNGYIDVKSEPGAGTTFSVFLPVFRNLSR